MVGLYLVGLTRLAFRGNWHDLAAARILGWALALACVVVLISVGLQYGRPDRPWTSRKRVTAFVVLGAIVAGSVASFAFQDTGWGRLLMQTVPIGAMVFFVLD